MRLSACVALLCFVAHASSNPQVLNFPVSKSRHEWKCFRASLAAWGTFSRGSPDRGETGATTCEIFFLNCNTCISHNIQYFSIYSVLIVCSVCSQYCDRHGRAVDCCKDWRDWSSELNNEHFEEKPPMICQSITYFARPQSQSTGGGRPSSGGEYFTFSLHLIDWLIIHRIDWLIITLWPLPRWGKMLKLWTKPPVPGYMASIIHHHSPCQYIVILCWCVIKLPRSFSHPYFRQQMNKNYFLGGRLPGVLATWVHILHGQWGSFLLLLKWYSPSSSSLKEKLTCVLVETFLLAAHFHSVPFSRQFISTWIFLYIFTRLLFCQQFIFTQLWSFLGNTYFHSACAGLFFEVLPNSNSSHFK